MGGPDSRSCKSWRARDSLLMMVPTGIPRTSAASRNSGNEGKAAEELGMHRNTLSRTIADLKLDAKELRNGTRRPPRSARPITLDKKLAR